MTVLDERAAPAPAPVTAPATHRLRIMDRTGDSTLTWTPDNEVEVAAARGAFAKMRDAGYLAYKVEDGEREQIRRFDEALGEVVMTPPLVGG